jgi:cobalt-precorrin 5A hydrolase
MKIRVLSFTNNGAVLAEKLKTSFDAHDIDIVPKGTPLNDTCSAAFRDGEALVFIGAMGIAVRSIAPFVRDKLQDPPVVVMDELGRFVIPLLSGHVGGANGLALEIAEATGAEPVITTATDINEVFSVDLFAKENGLTIENREGIAKVSSAALRDRAVTISIRNYPPEGPVDVLIDDMPESSLKDAASIVLCPKRYAIGMGCRRGKPYEELRAFAEKVLSENGIELKYAGCIASIDVKKDEAGLQKLSQAWRMPLVTFDADLLAKAKGIFDHSDTVLEKVGVDNVCERAAVLAAGRSSKLVVKKNAENGMTIAVAEIKR